MVGSSKEEWRRLIEDRVACKSVYDTPLAVESAEQLQCLVSLVWYAEKEVESICGKRQTCGNGKGRGSNPGERRVERS